MPDKKRRWDIKEDALMTMLHAGPILVFLYIFSRISPALKEITGVFPLRFFIAGIALILVTMAFYHIPDAIRKILSNKHKGGKR